jgi:hypothetical protein
MSHCENIDGKCGASWCDCDYQRRKKSVGSLASAPCSRLRIPRHLLELRIRNAIADKEMVTAMANRDLQCGDGWRCDYAEWHREVSKEIEELFILSANSQAQARPALPDAECSEQPTNETK